jgi:hypothetical protein
VTATGIEEVFLRHNAGRHFVALTYRLRKDREVHNTFASCFLVELAGDWFLLTAGHWLKHEETGLERLPAAGYRIDKIVLVDAFAGHTGSPLPFSFDMADWLAIYDDAEGFDIAALPIHPFYRRGLESAGVSAIELHATGPAEFHEDSQLALVGVPAESFEKKGANTAMKLVLVPLTAYAGDSLPYGRLAQLIIDRHGSLAADWGGKATFRRFLEALDLGKLRIDWSVAGGYVTDPSFPAAVPGSTSASTMPDWGSDSDLLPVMNLVHAATGMPLLSPVELHAVLASLSADLQVQPFQLAETGKRVRDRCREAGHAISRADVSFVLKGIVLGGHPFGQGTDDPKNLAQRFIDSALELSRREQLPLDESQVAQVRTWAERSIAS